VLYRDVSHRERLTGSSKYTNWKRFWLSVADLRGVMWLRKRCRLPQGLERL
jgi:dolichol-phosphate mannosyltransferase